MASILCVTSDLAGILYSSVELARRLVLDGHRVTVASFVEARATVEAQGLDFVPLERSRYPDFIAADRRLGVFKRLRRLEERRRDALDALAVEDLLEAARRMAPDLILIDGELHEQIIALAGAFSDGGPPIVGLNTFVSIWRRPGLPPPNRRATPGVGWQGSRFGMWLLWQALWLKKQLRAGRLRLQRVGCDRLSLLRRLADQHGFDFRRETDTTQWLMPFTYRRLPVLSLHALEFEFPHQPPEHVTYVGPLLLETRRDRTSPEDRAQLQELYDTCRDGRQKLIYAAFGSFFTSNLGFLRRLAVTAAERPDWELVISLGGKREPAELGELPERVHAFRWLPQLEVLQHASVAITHGGINTLDE
ncbi:MAG: hypothetical protein AAF560_26755, partial [Acidobacteriota bacterium]